MFNHWDPMPLSVATANVNWSGIRLLGHVAEKMVCEIEFCLIGEKTISFTKKFNSSCTLY